MQNNNFYKSCFHSNYYPLSILDKVEILDLLVKHKVLCSSSRLQKSLFAHFLRLAQQWANTLYVNNPTFGANWLTDYLSLLVFGLGAETTFASVADMLRRWEVPTGK